MDPLRLLAGLLLCAGTLPLPALGCLLGLFGIGMSRQGRFPAGGVSFGGGMSLSYAMLMAAAACSGACQAILWTHPALAGFAKASLAAPALLALPPALLRLASFDWGGHGSESVRALLPESAPERIFTEGAELICAPWSCMAGKGLVSAAQGHCVAPAKGIAERVASMGPAATIVSSAFRPLPPGGHPPAVDKARWLAVDVHGPASLHLRIPKGIDAADEPSLLAWALGRLRAAGFEPIGVPMLPSMRGADHGQFYEGPDIPTGATLPEEAFAIARAIQAAREIGAQIAPEASAKPATSSRL